MSARASAEASRSFRCRLKVGSPDGEDFVVVPAHTDAVRLAERSGLPLPRVYSDARAAFGSEEISASRAPERS